MTIHEIEVDDNTDTVVSDKVLGPGKHSVAYQETTVEISVGADDSVTLDLASATGDLSNIRVLGLGVDQYLTEDRIQETPQVRVKPPRGSSAVVIYGDDNHKSVVCTIDTVGLIGKSRIDVK